MTKFNEAQLAFLGRRIEFKSANPDNGFDVLGDVEGSVWGSVWGNVEGSVWGSVWGNVWGSVVGDVEGFVRAKPANKED